MKELETEMDDPQGISVVTRPPLKMNALLLSKECGILIEMRDGEGMKAPRFWRKVTTCEILNSSPIRLPDGITAAKTPPMHHSST